MRSLLITCLALFLSVAHLSRADGQSTPVDKTRSSSTLQVAPLPADAFSILVPDNIHIGEAPDGQQGRPLDVIVTFSPDGKLLAACYWGDSSVCLWELASKRVRFTLDRFAKGPFRPLAFSADGKRLLVGKTSAISSYSVDTGKQIENYAINEDGRDLYHNPVIQLGSDGKILAAICGKDAGDKGPFGEKNFAFAVLSWDMRAGRRVSANPLPEDMMSNYGRFSGDGRLVALPSGSVVEVATGKELVRVHKSGMGMTTAVALSSDGAYVAVGINEKDNGPNRANAREMAVGVMRFSPGFQSRDSRPETSPTSPSCRGIVKW